MDSSKAHFSKDIYITSAFWQEKLNQLTNPTAMRMADDLDPSGPLGIGPGDDIFWKGFKHNSGKQDTNVDFLLRVKRKHPEKIVLVQIGEFYESWAIDSVFLVEHAGLNRMGRGGPRAGTPLANIQAILDRLTQAGFSVVVCEQTDNLSKAGRKTRFIAEIVTPSSPVYTYGLAMDKRRSDALFPDCPPEFGVVRDKRGFTVVEVNPDLRTVLVMDSLTQEAAQMRLVRYGGRLNRILAHENVDSDFFEDCRLHHEHIVKITGYKPADFPRRVEELIKLDLSLAADCVFTYTKPFEGKDTMRPRPLYQGSAQQIGLLPEHGIPDLIDHMLTKVSPVTCKNLLRNYLLNPPPRDVAESMRAVIDFMLNRHIAWPDFPVSNPARYIKTMQKGEISPEILKDLHKIAMSFDACRKGDGVPVLADIFTVVGHLANMHVDMKLLGKSCDRILDIVTPVIPKSEDYFYMPQDEQISRTLFEYIEDEFRGRIARDSNAQIAKLYAEAEEMAAAYEEALRQDLLPMVREKYVALSFDVHNLALWLRGSPQGKENMCHPCDRYGKPVRDRWTTARVETALQAYKTAVADLRQAISELLKDVSARLAHSTLPIVHLVIFSNLMRTLTLHVREAKVCGWGNDVIYGGKDQSRVILKDFFPYWMDQRMAVKNDLDIQGTMLLTGHNMAGKSTTIRSSAAVTLLASSGLMFPGRQVAIYRPIDGWFIRTGTHDDPAAGLSSFAVEINEVRTALRDASSGSFILIDELGKGTESRAGHAIAGSILEYLAKNNIRAIFSTHWHELFYNPEIDVSSMRQLQMEMSGSEPTYKVIFGSCLTSFAFSAARRIGLDNDIVERACVIAEAYPVYRNSSYVLRPAAGIRQQPALYGFTLDRAAKVLSRVARVKEEQIRHAGKEDKAFLTDINQSVVYVLQTAKGFFYVGETDNIDGRLAAHRKDAQKKDAKLIYAPVAKGKSRSRSIETELINSLREEGFPMLSVNDAAHGHFGGDRQ